VRYNEDSTASESQRLVFSELKDTRGRTHKEYTHRRLEIAEQQKKRAVADYPFLRLRGAWVIGLAVTISFSATLVSRRYNAQLTAPWVVCSERAHQF
jgi:hypothetical protein